MTKSWHPYSGKTCLLIRLSGRLPTWGSLNFALSLQNADLVRKQLRQTSSHLGHWPSGEQGLKMTLVMFNPGPAAKIALLGRRTSHRSDVCYFRTYYGWKQADGPVQMFPDCLSLVIQRSQSQKEVPHLMTVVSFSHFFFFFPVLNPFLSSGHRETKTLFSREKNSLLSQIQLN